MTKTSARAAGSASVTQVALEQAKVFVALSPGLGLGEPRAKIEPVPSKLTKRSGLASIWPDETSGAPAATAVARPASASPKRRPQSPRPPSRWRQGSAYALDFFIVVGSVALCLVAASLGMRTQGDPGKGAWAFSLKFFDPLTWSWLRAIPVYQVLLGVYAVFFVYLLIFRLLVGRTLGQALLSFKLGRRTR